jgi:Ras-related protein Rab-1A
MGGLFSKKKKTPNGGIKIKGNAANETKEYPAFKILMIGDPSVGKSSLLLRYADNEFTNNFISTIGVDYKEKSVQLNNNNKVNIQIWDTAGQERFRTITSSYYRGAQGMILTFDLSNEASFKSLSKWLQEVERYAEEDVVVVLAGNKLDMGQATFKVNAQEIEDFKSKYGLDYFQTSAKDGTNVSQLFQRLTEQVVERFNNQV